MKPVTWESLDWAFCGAELLMLRGGASHVCCLKLAPQPLVLGSLPLSCRKPASAYTEMHSGKSQT